MQSLSRLDSPQVQQKLISGNEPYTQVGSVLFTSATEDLGLVILENSRAFLKWGGNVV